MNLNAPLPDTAALRQLTARIERMTREIKADTLRLKAGYNFGQPRLPAGNSDGGQWSDGGGSGDGSPSRSRTRPSSVGRVAKPGSAKPASRAPKPARSPRRTMTAEELARFNENAPEGTPPEDLEFDPRFGVPRWYASGAVKPSESPLDYIGVVGAVHASGSIAKTTVAEAAATIRVLRVRVAGKRAAEESTEKIRKAADSVEEFLGGRPDVKNMITNPKGDIVLIKGDKKFRMDVRHPGTKRGSDGNKIPEQPHFHLQELKNGKWVDATETHRIYFKE